MKKNLNIALIPGDGIGMEVMPEGYRLVFIMYVIEGYRHNEIATYLDISINTSKSQLSKAKAFIRKKINSVKYE